MAAVISVKDRQVINDDLWENGGDQFLRHFSGKSLIFQKETWQSEQQQLKWKNYCPGYQYLKM